MKSMEVDASGIGKKLVRQRKKFVISLLVFIIILYIVLAYLALMPREDKQMATLRSQRSQELNIIFDKKLLEKLRNAGATINVFGESGKNPFYSF